MELNVPLYRGELWLTAGDAEALNDSLRGFTLSDGCSRVSFVEVVDPPVVALRSNLSGPASSAVSNPRATKRPSVSVSALDDSHAGRSRTSIMSSKSDSSAGTVTLKNRVVGDGQQGLKAPEYPWTGVGLVGSGPRPPTSLVSVLRRFVKECVLSGEQSQSTSGMDASGTAMETYAGSLEHLKKYPSMDDFLSHLDHQGLAALKYHTRPEVTLGSVLARVEAGSYFDHYEFLVDVSAIHSYWQKAVGWLARQVQENPQLLGQMIVVQPYFASVDLLRTVISYLMSHVSEIADEDYRYVSTETLNQLSSAGVSASSLSAARNGLVAAGRSGSDGVSRGSGDSSRSRDRHGASYGQGPSYGQGNRLVGGHSHGSSSNKHRGSVSSRSGHGGSDGAGGQQSGEGLWNLQAQVNMLARQVQTLSSSGKPRKSVDRTGGLGSHGALGHSSLGALGHSNLSGLGSSGHAYTSQDGFGSTGGSMIQGSSGTGASGAQSWFLQDDEDRSMGTNQSIVPGGSASLVLPLTEAEIESLESDIGRLPSEEAEYIINALMKGEMSSAVAVADDAYELDIHQLPPAKQRSLRKYVSRKLSGLETQQALQRLKQLAVSDDIAAVTEQFTKKLIHASEPPRNGRDHTVGSGSGSGSSMTSASVGSTARSQANGGTAPAAGLPATKPSPSPKALPALKAQPSASSVDIDMLWSLASSGGSASSKPADGKPAEAPKSLW